jgi:hypothetical protein
MRLKNSAQCAQRVIFDRINGIYRMEENSPVLSDYPVNPVNPVKEKVRRSLPAKKLVNL